MNSPPVRVHASPSGVRIGDCDLDELRVRYAQQPVTHPAPTPSPLETAQAERDQTQATLAAIVDALSRVTGELEDAHAKLQEELPAFAVQLAVGIAQEILRRELDNGNYDIEAIVRSTLAVADTGRSACTLHLHPDDVALLDPARFRSNTKFDSDPDIARGDVHVSTPQGLLVRDIDATLTRVREGLLEALR